MVFQVGYITGIMGWLNLLAGACVGVFVDRYRRDTALTGAAIVSLLAIVCSLLAILSQPIFHFSNNSEYLYLSVAYPMWGLFKGVYSPALQAIFADSVPSKTKDSVTRTKYFTMKTQFGLAAGTLGPAISMFLFAGLGNNWCVSCNFASQSVNLADTLWCA
jgi:MFS family permease